MKESRIDFDPNVSRRATRPAPRVLSVIAFLVIAILLLFNGIASLVSANAEEKQACYAEVAAWNDYFSMQTMAEMMTGNPVDPEASHTYIYQGLTQCAKEFPD